MFYTIHRAIKFLCFCALLAVAAKLYQHRGVLEPASIWYDVWDNGGFQLPTPPTITGKVEQVLNSQTFVITYRATNRYERYNVRLAGLKDATGEISLEWIEREKQRRQNLTDLIDKQRVHIELTYQNGINLAGVAFVGGTNVNVELVHKGNARTNKDLVKGLPKETQYAMLWAHRHREK